MKPFNAQQLRQWAQDSWRGWLGAIAFYTAIPIPPHWNLEFQGVARWAPCIGLLLGGLLTLLDISLQYGGVPMLTRSALIVVSWVALTGGLHLDGVMDTADGLAVGDPQRRLAVMADSMTGAFGAMAAVAVLLLKTVALSELSQDRGLALIAAAGWGRWGQIVAIAAYPYLKPTGKGAFHKGAIRVPQDILLGGCLVVGVCGLPLLQSAQTHPALPLFLVMVLGGCAIAILTGVWFYRQLGGHTGDTYGAVVEWTETLFLCLLTPLLHSVS